MNAFVFDPPAPQGVEVLSGGLFPVRRIFCIGKNYADHVKEMGAEPKTTPPVFFTKPSDATVASGAVIPYPPATQNLHFEGELVVAIGASGKDLKSRSEADALIYGHAAGCDLTRRDLQAEAKVQGGPWDTGKAFDRSAPVGAIAPVADYPCDAFGDARLVTKVNGQIRQEAALAEMIWSVPEILIALSQLFELKPGDLAFTGTPAGVGPVQPGDKVEVAVGALSPLAFEIGDA